MVILPLTLNRDVVQLIYLEHRIGMDCSHFTLNIVLGRISVILPFTLYSDEV